MENKATSETNPPIDWRDYIVCDPAILCGKPTLKGTRLSVEFVLDLLAGGWTNEDLADSYPNLTEARLQAVFGYAAGVVRGTRPALLPKAVKSFPFAKGTILGAIPNFAYFLRLMAGVESLRAAIRWYIRIENDVSFVWSRDVVAAAIFGAGTCAELVRCLRLGEKKGFIHREMLDDDMELERVWERLFSDSPDDMLRKTHRMRDKYFGHWDATVLDNFIEFQQACDETEPFIESEGGGFLDTRYLWPITAFAHDLAGLPSNEGYTEDQKEIFHGLFRDLWPQVERLVNEILTVWIDRAIASGQMKFEPVEYVEPRK